MGTGITRFFVWFSLENLLLYLYAVGGFGKYHGTTHCNHVSDHSDRYKAWPNFFLNSRCDLSPANQFLISILKCQLRIRKKKLNV